MAGWPEISPTTSTVCRGPHSRVTRGGSPALETSSNTFWETAFETVSGKAGPTETAFADRRLPGKRSNARTPRAAESARRASTSAPSTPLISGRSPLNVHDETAAFARTSP